MKKKYAHKIIREKTEFRAFQSQVTFSQLFFKTFLSKSKKDIYKCPFSKTKNTFGFFFAVFLVL